MTPRKRLRYCEHSRTEVKGMLTVDDYGAIRRAHRDGMLIKRIALEFEHSRNTIRKILKHPEPNPIPRERNRTAPVLGLFQPIIDQLLLDEEEAPPNQRHTAMQVFRRLQYYPGNKEGHIPTRSASEGSDEIK